MGAHCRRVRHAVLGGVLLGLSMAGRAPAADTVELSPFSCCDGQFRETAVGRRETVWQSVGGHMYFYFNVPDSFEFTPGSPVYLKVSFYDEGYGSVAVEYDSTEGRSLADKYRDAEKQTGSLRTNSRGFVDAYYELSLPRFAGGQNGGADFRLSLRGGGDVPLSVKSVTIQNHAFETFRQDTVELTPFSCCDGQFQHTTIQGEPVWRNVAGHSYMYFNVPDQWEFSPGVPVYLKVTYYDEGHGTVLVQYDSAWGNSPPDKYRRSETHTRSSRVDTGAFADSYHELLLPKLAGRQNGGADFRLCLATGADGDVPLCVKAVTIKNAPFEDFRFQYVLTKPWLGPYAGSTKDYVDATTLNHKVMVGYQGWFRTPNDLADRGWTHWCRDGVMIPENFTVDMWPDLAGFGEDELFRAGDVVTRSGRPAYVFSSTTRETVRRHFQRMRKYNIDGAFLQRFVHPNTSGAWGHDEWVLHHVREAANLEGRIWAIEYDVSSLGNEPDPYDVITTDWKWLVDTVKILEDPRYAHEEGDAVVFVWGLPFPDRNFQKSTANAIIDFFQNDPDYGGRYVIGGVPWWWRDMIDWYDHFRRYDGVLAWMPMDQAGYAADRLTLSYWGIDYFPHVWPGFSWAHLQRQRGDQDYTSRERGAFFWRKIREAVGGGASRLFVGMFDEYDEGTAIMPMSDDPPHPPAQWGRFITNEGRRSDWWMLLAGEARGMLLGHRPYSAWMPTEQELSNRSNVGPEVWIDLGAVDVPNELYRRVPADGDTRAELFAGRDCRCNAVPGSDCCFYFDVDSRFAHQASQGLDVTVEVEYFDSVGSVELSLDYDGAGGPYTRHPLAIETQGSGQWRTVRFEIADAHFGNRQNAGADLRVRSAGWQRLYIDRVWVRKEATGTE